MMEPSPIVRFSTKLLQRRDRLTVFREMFARGAANADMIPLDDEIYAKGILRNLPGASVFWVDNSRYVVEGPYDPSLVGDDFVLVWADSPVPVVGTHLGRDVLVTQDQAMIFSCSDRITCRNDAPMQHLTVKINRSLLSPVIKELSDQLVKGIDTKTNSFRLLKNYVRFLLRESTSTSSMAFDSTVTAHIVDLVALSVGAKGDAAERARRRGLRAARFESIKRMLLAKLDDPTLSVHDAARHQSVSPRYVQQLFEQDGTTFSAWVLGMRLEQVHRTLADPGTIARPIGLVALDAGFNDVSYFNHAFRRRYGETPSDVRQRAIEQDFT